MLILILTSTEGCIKIPDKDELLNDLKKILSELQANYNVTSEEAIGLTQEKEIPVSIFSTERGPLESLVIYLRETGKLDFTTISTLLKRDYQTIWTSYNLGSKKTSEGISHSRVVVPLDIFNSRELRIFESLVKFLREKKSLRYRDIAILLNRNDRTIWTLYNRAIKKVRK